MIVHLRLMAEFYQTFFYANCAIFKRFGNVSRRILTL